MINEELKQLLPRSVDGLVRLRANPLITNARVDELEEMLSTADHDAQIARIEVEIRSSITYAREQEELIRSLTDLVNRLLRQYQSANNRYQQGWDARLDDILARLSVDDSTELLVTLQNIAILDQPF